MHLTYLHVRPSSLIYQPSCVRPAEENWAFQAFDILKTLPSSKGVKK